jgi:hypothetical protein
VRTSSSSFARRKTRCFSVNTLSESDCMMSKSECSWESSRSWCTLSRSAFSFFMIVATWRSSSRRWLMQIRREYQNWLRKKSSTWDDWRKSFSTKTNKSASCWNSSSSRRSTQSFNDISSETTKFTRARDFFVTAKSSNATIADDMITSKISVSESQNAIDAKSQSIRKASVRCSSSKQNAQYVKNLMKLETDIVAHVSRRWRRRNRRQTTTSHSILSSRRSSDSLSCSVHHSSKLISHPAV